VTTATDQRGVTHTYAYDSAGRLAADVVTSLGPSSQHVDGSVMAIVTGYDDLGRVQSVTSYDTNNAALWAPSNPCYVVNQVKEAYDGWGDLSQEWQSPAGPVNGSTPSVQYVYADGSGTSGVAAYLQLSELIYPNGRILHYEYNSGADQSLGRVSAIADDDGSGGAGQVDAAYTYLGADTIVTENYEQPQVKLDYTNGSGQITGLDRFGRVADQYWTSYGQNSGNAGTLDGYSYTYDADGNVLSRTNAVDSVMSEFYRYNSLDELTDFQRGASQAPVGSGANEQQYGLDGLGNFSSINNNGVTQTRTANAANEITGITGGTVTPAYDLAGNMTTMPQPGNATVGLTCVYDAWDRLVEVTSGSTVVAQYEYDGTGRLVSETAGATTTYSFYAGQSLIETRVGGTAATNVQYQYVWSLRGDAIPILRDTYSAGALQSASRIYYTTDANGNVTALIGLSGGTWTVIERYVYDAYGTVTVYNPAWTTALGGYASSTVGNTLFFGGLSVDPATGLFHALFRWYNSALATWTATDPLGEAGSGPNLYGYCGDSPANWTDPSGLADESTLWTIASWYWNGTVSTVMPLYGMDKFIMNEPGRAGRVYDSLRRSDYGPVAAGLITTDVVVADIIPVTAATMPFDRTDPDPAVPEHGLLESSLNAVNAWAQLGLIGWGGMRGVRGASRMARGAARPGASSEPAAPKAPKASPTSPEPAPASRCPGAPSNATPSNEASRVWYNEQLKKININVPASEANARTINAARNALKQQARDLMADRAEAARLDQNFPLKSFDYYVEKYRAQGFEGEALTPTPRKTRFRLLAKHFRTGLLTRRVPSKGFEVYPT
jgi:RHS repeat-associated protein